MYPTLYHALLDLTGLDLSFLKFINSFGFFVALAFFAASWTMAMEFRRQESNGLLKPWKTKFTVGAPATPWQLISSALFGFLIGWKVLGLILNLDEATANTQEYLLSMQGNVIGGIVLALLFAWGKYREKEKAKLAAPKTEEVTVHAYEQAGSITLMAALGGFAGAKLFHLLENPDELVQFFTNPKAANFFSGLTMYGGLIVGGILVIRYFKKHGIPPLLGMDAAAPGLMLSYAIGRIGCQVSGDGDWGINNTAPTPSWLPEWLWKYDYPNNVLSAGVPITDGTVFPGYGNHLVPTVFPTPIYETVMCTALFLVLWWMRKRISVPGVIFFVYLIMNGVERFFIEKIRINTHLFGNITQAEVISTLLVLLGIGGIIWVRKLHQQKTMANAT